jgi:hypothetical protein
LIHLFQFLYQVNISGIEIFASETYGGLYPLFRLTSSQLTSLFIVRLLND